MVSTRRKAMSLIEVLAALVIAATIAALGIQYLRPAGEAGKQRSCDMTREILQSHAQQYTESTGRTPSPDLRELGTTQFYGTVLPNCPVTGQSYRLNQSGTIICPTHEATRAK